MASLSEASSYWSKYFEDVQPCLFPRYGGLPDEAVHVSSIMVDTCHGSKLQEMAAKDPSSFYSTIQAAWAILLNSYTGHEDTCFNHQEYRAGADHPVSNSKTLLVRLKLEQTMSLAQIRDYAREAYEKGLTYEFALDGEDPESFRALPDDLCNTKIVFGSSDCGVKSAEVSEGQAGSGIKLNPQVS
jgi:hypothetical protein